MAKKTTAKQNTNNGESKFKGIRNFFTSERTRFITGLVISIVTIYVGLALISFFFTGGADQSKIENIPLSDLVINRGSVENWTGVRGAFLADLLMNRWFGISSFLILFFLGSVGAKLMNLSRVSLLKRFLFSAAMLIWGSLFFAFIFIRGYEDTFIYLGGQHGYYLSEVMMNNIGIPGTVLLLVGLFLIVAIFTSKRTIPFLQNVFSFGWLKNRLKRDKSETTEVPEEEEDEEDPRAELVRRLLEYKMYKYMAQELEEREQEAELLFFKEPTIPREVAKYEEPLDLDKLLDGLTLAKLQKVFDAVMKRNANKLDPVRSRFSTIRREPISLEQKVRSVLSYAREHRHFKFSDVLERESDRLEIVVAFLAVLELMKMGRIHLVQEKLFDEIQWMWMKRKTRQSWNFRRRKEKSMPELDEKREEAIVEAVLFTMGKSVELRQLAAALGTDTERAEAAVRRLQSRYEAEKRGMQITQLEDSWQMATRAEYYENLIRVAATPKKQILTDVVLETLSIIAYKQPITKLEIEKIRGVKSDHAVNKLIEYNLVYEVGRLDVPGRPALFATTEEFLRRFGVGSTKELPEPAPGRIDEFRMEAEEELKFERKLPEEAEKEMKY